MKISYRTNPIIEKIEKKSLGKQGVYESDFKSFELAKDLIIADWKKFAQSFSENIYIITQPFEDAILASREKLATPELFEKTQSGSGVLIYNNKITTCYYLKNTDTDNWDLVVFQFFKDILIFYYSDLDKMNSFLSQEIIHAGKETLYHAAQRQIGILMLVLNFIKFAPVEIKEIGAGKRVQDINCKYANDTRSNVKIMDSTWFTTLVKSEGFTVRGHFRLQACGTGMKERKLVWISDFEKHGYTRHFKRPVTLEEFEF